MNRVWLLWSVAALTTACSAQSVAPGSDEGGTGDGASVLSPDGALERDRAPDASRPEATPVDAGSRCPGHETLCHEQCVDTTLDPFDCGACGHACTGGGECVLGTCVMPCARPNALCGTSCVDTSSDANHCGTCGRVCPSGTTCSSGLCLSAETQRYVLERDTNVNWVDACSAPGHVNILVATDDGVSDVTMPFTTRYWNLGVSQGAPITVCSNGWIGMAGATLAALTGTIPSTASPRSVIAAYWNDLVTRSSGVCVATVGSAPARRFAVEWSDVRFYGGSTDAHLTFEAVFNESDGSIDLLYPTLDGSGRATVGLENPAGTAAVATCQVGGVCDVATGTALHFHPVP